MAEENQGGLAWSRALVPASAGEGAQGARRARGEAGSCKGNRELTSPGRPFTHSPTLLPHFSRETFSESRSLALGPIALTGPSLRVLLFCLGLCTAVKRVLLPCNSEVSAARQASCMFHT